MKLHTGRWNVRRAQAMTEYVILGVLVAITVLGAVFWFGDEIFNAFAFKGAKPVQQLDLTK